MKKMLVIVFSLFVLFSSAQSFEVLISANYNGDHLVGQRVDLILNKASVEANKLPNNKSWNTGHTPVRVVMSGDDKPIKNSDVILTKESLDIKNLTSKPIVFESMQISNLTFDENGKVILNYLENDFERLSFIIITEKSFIDYEWINLDHVKYRENRLDYFDLKNLETIGNQYFINDEEVVCVIVLSII